MKCREIAQYSNCMYWTLSDIIPKVNVNFTNQIFLQTCILKVIKQVVLYMLKIDINLVILLISQYVIVIPVVCVMLFS